MIRIIYYIFGFLILTCSAVAKPISVEEKISALNKNLPKYKVNKIAHAIRINSTKYKINPDIFLKILMQESGFDQKKVSTTGDVSIAQINYVIWEKEFKRLSFKKINLPLLLSDETYAINIMGIILNQIKKKYEHRERFWYTRYHSSNMRPRINYTNLLVKHEKILAKNR